MDALTGMILTKHQYALLAYHELVTSFQLLRRLALVDWYRLPLWNGHLARRLYQNDFQGPNNWQSLSSFSQ
jgi:hypothetical protein